MPGSKVIHDSVHGSVKVEGRLPRPAGAAGDAAPARGAPARVWPTLVFPGANHTRLEHSLGTYHIADQMARALQLPEQERTTVLAAALLHDIGHAPFSHTLEEVIHDRMGKDHMDISTDLIRGRYPVVSAEDLEHPRAAGPRCPRSWRPSGISVDEVCDLIASSHQDLSARARSCWWRRGRPTSAATNYLSQIISGPLDVDQMDYLQRDAYYTGVAHGTIDIDRLLQTVAIFHGDLVINKSGLVAAEGLLVATIADVHLGLLPQDRPHRRDDAVQGGGAWPPPRSSRTSIGTPIAPFPPSSWPAGGRPPGS